MPKTIGNKVLRDLREMHGLSQRAAAERARVSHIQWAQVEAGAPKSFSTEGWLSIWNAFESELRAMGFGCDDLLRGHRKSGRKISTG